MGLAETIVCVEMGGNAVKVRIVDTHKDKFTDLNCTVHSWVSQCVTCYIYKL